MRKFGNMKILGILLSINIIFFVVLHVSIICPEKGVECPRVVSPTYFGDGYHTIILPDGTLKAEFTILNGRKNGEFTDRFNNGKTKSEGIYQDGKRSGQWTYYNEKGEVAYELCYGGC